MRIPLLLLMGAIVGVMFVMLMLNIVRIGAAMFLVDMSTDKPLPDVGADR